MKKLLSTFSLFILTTASIAQTKQQTLEYINEVFRTHNDRTNFSDISEKSPTTLIYSYEMLTTTITYEFNPKNGISFLISSNPRKSEYTISFKKNSVKRKMKGSDEELSDTVEISNLIGMSEKEIQKFTKALKYLFKLYGGNLRDPAF